jgi:hypothetical protein
MPSSNSLYADLAGSSPSLEKDDWIPAFAVMTEVGRYQKDRIPHKRCFLFLGDVYF